MSHSSISMFSLTVVGSMCTHTVIISSASANKTVQPCLGHSAPDRTWPTPPAATGPPIEVSAEIGTVLTQTSPWGMVGVNIDFWGLDTVFGHDWGKCSALAFNTTDTRLIELVKGISGGMLRVGGTPADWTLYDVLPDICSPKNLGKNGQCMTMERWDALNEFAVQTGMHMFFDLNAMWTRDKNDRKSDINFDMINGLFKHTARLAARGKSAVTAWQFGNELTAHCSVNSTIDPTVYGRDYVMMHGLLKEAWEAEGLDAATAPFFEGPDDTPEGGTEVTAPFFGPMLAAANGTVKALGFHDYGWTFPPYSCEPLDVKCNDRFTDNRAALYSTISKSYTHDPLPVYMTEASFHTDGGGHRLYQHWYEPSPWYANVLGRAAKKGIQLFSRQTLIGGKYELINHTTGEPNPDFYVAYFFHNLMGRDVRAVDVTPAAGAGTVGGGGATDDIRVHAHSNGTSTTVLVVSFSNTSASKVTLTGEGIICGSPQLYQLTGALTSDRIYFNGAPIPLGRDGYPDKLTPKQMDSSSEIEMPPLSISFLHYRGGPCSEEAKTRN